VTAPALLFIGGLSPSEMIIVLLLGLLLFGSKLPDVGRQLGRSLMEFKKGLKGFTDDMQATERETERLIAESEERERRRLAARKADAERKPELGPPTTSSPAPATPSLPPSDDDKPAQA
jgi:sec-independent protein translocase protein TatA